MLLAVTVDMLSFPVDSSGDRGVRYQKIKFLPFRYMLEP